MNKLKLIVYVTSLVPFVSAAGETVSTLDKILGFVIPIAMVGLFLMLIYRAFKEPMDKLFAFIKEKMSNDNGMPEQQSRYRGGGYMIPGDIKYMR